MSLNRFLDRLFRCFSRKGFGLQSPFAYQLQQYVIDQKLPYYAYSELYKILRENYPNSTFSRKSLELIFRLANFMQAKQVWLPNQPNWAIVRLYIEKGCSATTILDYTHLEDVLQSSASPQWICMNLCTDSVAFLKKFVPVANTMIYLADIRKDRMCLNLWENLCKELDESCIFDLYSYGIIYFGNSITPGKYKTTVF